MRGRYRLWCRFSFLMMGFLLAPYMGRAQEVGREVRIMLPPFLGSADPAQGSGLSDLFSWCLSRLNRVELITGREVFQALQWDLGWRGLSTGEATELGRRLQAQVVLLIRYALQEGRLSYEVFLGDLRGEIHWRHLSFAGKPWPEAHQLHLRLAREVLHLLKLPLEASEERRVLAACSHPLPLQQALYLYGQARLKEWGGEAEGATAIYARAGEVASGFALPFFRQGEVFEILGSRWRAAGAYRRAIQADGRFVEAYKRLGDLLARSPRRLFEQAVVAYQKAVEIDPDYAEAYVGLADALAALGKVDEAVGEYRRGLRVDPWSSRAHLGLAKIYYREKGLFHEAVAEYERALTLDPTFLEAQLGLGDLLEEKGLYREAITRYREVLRLKPRHTGALFAIARAYERVDVQEAIARWEHYLEVASEVPSEREWLAIARGHLEKLRGRQEEKAPTR
ncbi:MAG: tetratricopeptide repeat protein [Candidatus Methylomirabilales bacterium]